MVILVETKKIPNSCSRCQFFYDFGCKAQNRNFEKDDYDENIEENRNSKCPIKEIILMLPLENNKYIIEVKQ